MSTRRERAGRKNSTRCRNCGEFGPHYAPPGLGSPGVYVCERNEEKVRNFGLTPSLTQEQREAREQESWDEWRARTLGWMPVQGTTW